MVFDIMGKKFIEDQHRKQYKKNREELQEKVNPSRYTPEEREAIKKRLKQERGM